MSGNAVIYVRVSDSRQVDNTSLASQEDICRKWCGANGLAVKRVYVEQGESAKSADRPQFQAMFAQLEAEKRESISHVIVYKFDRFARNVDDGAVYRMKLRKLGIALRSATEKTDDSASGKLFTNILSAFGQFDNDQRAERTLSGMKARLQSGRWQWAAPTGYTNGSRKKESSGSHKDPSLVPHPDRGPLIAKLFELVATGDYTKSAALAKVTALGLRSAKGKPLTGETIRKILVNPIYTGEILIPKWGHSVKGDFTPLVSRSTFDRVQDILSGRAARPARRAKREDAFPLRGSLLCRKCEKPVTASISTGKLGGRFGYYHCHRGPQHFSMRAETMESAFVDLLERLTPLPERMKLIEEIFRKVWASRLENAQTESESLAKELAKLEAKKSRLLEQLAEGNISGAEYKSMADATAAQIAQVRDDLAMAKGSEIDLDTALGYLNHVLWNTGTIWQTSDLRGKQRIQRALFPDGLIYDQNSFGTPVTSGIYRLLNASSADESDLVAPQGFEPRLIGSEPTVLPLNEGAAAPNARTHTVSRERILKTRAPHYQFECTGASSPRSNSALNRIALSYSPLAKFFFDSRGRPK